VFTKQPTVQQLLVSKVLPELAAASYREMKTSTSGIPAYDSRRDFYCPRGLSALGNEARAAKCDADFRREQQASCEDAADPAAGPSTADPTPLDALVAQRSRALVALAKLSAFPASVVKSLVRSNPCKARACKELVTALRALQDASVEVVEHVMELEQQLLEVTEQDRRASGGLAICVRAGQEYVRAMRLDSRFVSRMPLARAVLGCRATSSDPFFVSVLAAAAAQVAGGAGPGAAAHAPPAGSARLRGARRRVARSTSSAEPGRPLPKPNAAARAAAAEAAALRRANASHRLAELSGSSSMPAWFHARESRAPRTRVTASAAAGVGRNDEVAEQGCKALKLIRVAQKEKWQRRQRRAARTAANSGAAAQRAAAAVALQRRLSRGPRAREYFNLVLIPRARNRARAKCWLAWRAKREFARAWLLRSGGHAFVREATSAKIVCVANAAKYLLCAGRHALRRAETAVALQQQAHRSLAAQWLRRVAAHAELVGEAQRVLRYLATAQAPAALWLRQCGRHAQLQARARSFLVAQGSMHFAREELVAFVEHTRFRERLRLMQNPGSRLSLADSLAWYQMKAEKHTSSYQKSGNRSDTHQHHQHHQHTRKMEKSHSHARQKHGKSHSQHRA
jgi:hypothetical protein